jgi:hypothetical protein
MTFNAKIMQNANREKNYHFLCNSFHKTWGVIILFRTIRVNKNIKIREDNGGKKYDLQKPF